MKQQLIYTVNIGEEFCEFQSLLELLDETIAEELGCVILGSRIESEDEVCENGEID